MMKWLLPVALVIGSVIVGVLSYESYMYHTYQPRGEDLADEAGQSCAADSECPQIYCIRAPCPQNICSDGICKLVIPSEDSGYDRSCGADSDCKLISADCSACSLEAVNVGQAEELDCSGYNGSVCRVAPLRVACESGKCVSAPYSR